MSELGEYYQDKKSVHERIKADALAKYPARMASPRFMVEVDMNEDNRLNYIAGATSEAAKTEQLIEIMQEVIRISDRKHDAWDRAKEFIQQWEEGKDKDKYEGSEFSEPAPGITLGCISPEARNLLDTIMEAWEKHFADMKEMHGAAMPETTFYGFAYWLVRWSGLIQPALTNPPK